MHVFGKSSTRLNVTQESTYHSLFIITTRSFRCVRVKLGRLFSAMLLLPLPVFHHDTTAEALFSFSSVSAVISLLQTWLWYSLVQAESIQVVSIPISACDLWMKLDGCATTTTGSRRECCSTVIMATPTLWQHCGAVHLCWFWNNFLKFKFGQMLNGNLFQFCLNFVSNETTTLSVVST